MIQLHFESIYSTEGRWEPCSAAFPLRQGELTDCRRVRVLDENGQPVPTQARATALYPDGSVKWLFTRFMAKVPALKAVDYALDLQAEPSGPAPLRADENGLDTGCLRFTTSMKPDTLFEQIASAYETYGSDAVSAPMLTDGQGVAYGFRMEKWELLEKGEVCAVLRGTGWVVQLLFGLIPW